MTPKKEQDIFDEENQVKLNFWKLETVGDSIKGVLVDKRVVTNMLKQPQVKQTIYTIMQDDETPIMVGGRGQGDPQVIAGLEQCKLGQYVGVKYLEERESTKPGMNAAKIIRVYTNGKMEQKVLDKHRGVDDSEEIDVDEVMKD